jgi:urease accessory protein UreH
VPVLIAPPVGITWLFILVTKQPKYGRTVLTVDPTACVILGETLLPGRVAHGEQHVYALFWSTTEACATDGALLFSDMLRFEPPMTALNTPHPWPNLARRWRCAARGTISRARRARARLAQAIATAEVMIVCNIP